jgi:hypothetical protein
MKPRRALAALKVGPRRSFQTAVGAGRIGYIYHTFIVQSARLSKELGDHGRLFRRTGHCDSRGKKIRPKRGP